MTRYRSRDDRRVVYVAINPTGAEELERARSRRRQAWSELLAALQPGEVHQLLALYEKMARRESHLA